LPLAGATKITSFDPPLPAIGTAHPSEPLQAWPVFFDPPIELASRRPGRSLNLDRWIDFAAICFAVLTWVEIPHIKLEHSCDLMEGCHAIG
jgi:hypothetical protein